MSRKFNAQMLIDEREKTRGSFTALADLKAQWISAIMRKHTRALKPTEREALEQILTKLTRVLMGKEFDLDSWQDIAGYATLVVNHFKGNEND
jgi:hypothetical protein